MNMEMFLLNTEDEAAVTPIHFINATNYIYINEDDNFIHKYCAQFYHQIIMKMYLMYQNTIQQNEEFFVTKTLFWIYYKMNKIVFNGRNHCYFLFSTTINFHHIWTYH